MVTGEEQLKTLYLLKGRNPEEIRGGGGGRNTNKCYGWMVPGTALRKGLAITIRCVRSAEEQQHSMHYNYSSILITILSLD